MICDVIELSRTVRFCLNGPGESSPAPTDNTFAAWPPMRGLGRYYELTVTCHGEADPVSGYFLNIKVIDQAVRDAVLPHLEQVIARQPATASLPMGELMRRILALLQPALNNAVAAVRLSLTPYLSLALQHAATPTTFATPATFNTPAAERHAMSSQAHEVLIRHQYEFSASHRLHVPQWDEAQNKQVFGKCNNPAGHGHNYRVEVVAGAAIDADGHLPPIETLDAIVNAVVIERYDHKNLNVDVDDFKAGNSSVENIAVAAHSLLRDPLAQAQLDLKEVSVWETGKTVCTYRGN